jgi:hypothetical protein
MAQPGRQLAPPDTDWTVQAADTIEGLVTSIRNKTTVPLTTVVRGVVYGILAAFAGGAAMVLMAIALVRLVDVLTGAGNVWIAHLSIGMVFTLVGVWAWSKRRPPER